MKRLIILSLLLILDSSAESWNSNCNRCHCKGKWANCQNTSLVEIPNNLSVEIQFFDLSENNITAIRNNQLNHLLNLLHLTVVNGKLVNIDTDAFLGLESLIHLDLSGNSIKTVEPGTFREILKIQEILLHHNKIESINDDTFKHLTHLIVVELNHNEILYVSEQSFVNLPKLEVILLDHNRLQTLDSAVITSLSSIKKFTLHDNFWMCTCCLKDFLGYVVENSLSLDTKCSFPKKLRNKLWTNVTENDLICKPSFPHDHHGGAF